MTLSLRCALRCLRRPFCKAVCLATWLILSASAVLAQGQLVISQIYGGGGNRGATLKNDFVELFNRGDAPARLDGLSLQYASASGANWNGRVDLPAKVLQPGRYFLIGLASGSGGTRSLPALDASGDIALSGTAGKLALVDGRAPLTGRCPDGPRVVDLVGYGGADCAETAPLAALSADRAGVRAGGGCTDSDNNAADFSTAVPMPRNSAAASHACAVAAVPVSGITRIPQIQGSGEASPLAGRTVTTEGVVTAVFPGLSGFNLQDDKGDGDAATSDAVFVFAPKLQGVQVGDRLRLSATVREFNTVTELVSPVILQVLGHGIAVTPTDVAWPVQGGLERYEGMLVRIVSRLTVSQNALLGRYGQLTLGAGGRLEIPTNRHPPGSPQAVAQGMDNARRRLVLDDGMSAPNPDPVPFIGTDGSVRVGDTVDGLTGVIDHGPVGASGQGRADYRLQATVPPAFARDNPRTAKPTAVGGDLRVAGFNVLNYFTSIDQPGATCRPGGTRADCRGADSAQEFMRQRAKIVAALRAIDADVVGLMEIENNGQVAVRDLVDALNAACGSVIYATVGPPAGGSGGDAIRLAMIYKPARVTPVGEAQSDTGALHHRLPLAQTFTTSGGARFSVVLGHFKSKACGDASGADADQGDGQGCWNARRVRQAEALHAFVERLSRAADSSAVLVIGDLNSYTMEDPVRRLGELGLVRLSDRSDMPYSFIFDGESGELDHALATPAMAALVTGMTVWHINADEPAVIDYNTESKPQDLYVPTPFRSSDHDPVIIGLALRRAVGGGMPSAFRR